MQERIAAMLACALHGAMPRAIWPRDEQFVVTDVPSVKPSRVADVARRHEVREVVVSAIGVEMVNDQRTLACLPTGYPVQRRSTPMTWMRSFADRVIQDDAMLGHARTTTRAKGVIRSRLIPIPLLRWWSFARSQVLCVTGSRTEATVTLRDISAACRKGLPAHDTRSINHFVTPFLLRVVYHYGG